MKNPILISLLMWWLAAPVRGAGVDIAWDGCLGDPGAVSNKSFACDQTLGAEQLLISFVPAISFTSVFLIEVAIDMRTRTDAMPAWWDVYGFNSCRRGGLDVDAFPAVLATPTCERWYASATIETASYDWRYPTADVARMVVQAHVSTASVIEGHHYLACRLLLNHGGAEGCAGCLDPIDITVSAVRLAKSFTVDQVLTQPQTSNVAHWQPDRATATRATSWAALKSLYR